MNQIFRIDVNAKRKSHSYNLFLNFTFKKDGITHLDILSFEFGNK